MCYFIKGFLRGKHNVYYELRTTNAPIVHTSRVLHVVEQKHAPHLKIYRRANGHNVLHTRFELVHSFAHLELRDKTRVGCLVNLYRQVFLPQVPVSLTACQSVAVTKRQEWHDPTSVPSSTGIQHILKFIDQKP